MKSPLLSKLLACMLLLFAFSAPSLAQNVGIGTAAPTQKLDVNGYVELGDETIGTAGTAGAIRYNSTLTTIEFHDGTSWQQLGGTAGWELTGNAGTTVGTNFLGTTDANSLSIRTDNTEAIRVNTDQNVGIGTNAPADALEISGPTANLRIDNTDESASGIILADDNTSSGQYAQIFYDNDNTGQDLSFYINSTTDPAMTIRSTQNVGIGTMNPGQELDVAGDTPIIAITDEDHPASNVSQYGLLGFYGNGGSLAASVGVPVGNRDLYIRNADDGTGDGIRFQTDGANDRMYIDEDGNVGINTLTPAGKLHTVLQGGGDYVRVTREASSGSGGEILSLNGSQGSTSRGLYMGYDTGIADFYITTEGVARDLVIGANGGYAIHVEASNQRVGIFEDNPQDVLHVVGTGRFEGTNAGANTRALLLRNTSGAFQSSVDIDFQTGNLIAGRIRAFESSSVDDESRLEFWTSEDGGTLTRQMRLSDKGNLTLENGYIQVGYENGSPQGAIRYNNFVDDFEGYVTGTGWVSLTGGGGGTLWTDNGTDLTPTNNENVVSGGDLVADAFNGVLNVGGAFDANTNVIGDALPAQNFATGDEDLAIQDDLEVDGQAYKPGGGNWVAVSDRRLKKDIRPFEDGLAQVLQIKPVYYHYNGKMGIDPEPEHIGVIAQEIKEVAPYTVKEEYYGRSYIEQEDGTEVLENEGKPFYTYNGTAINYMLINAVKELNAENKKLGEENAELKAQLQAHEERLQRLEQLLENK